MRMAVYGVKNLHQNTESRMREPTQKVVIVGAGPGGLAAAILLQRSGVDVTVVERREIPGGRTSTIERNGFQFDTGPTFFLYPRVLREILAAAGRNLEEEIPMYRLDPQYRLVFGAGGELLATPDLARMERAIAELSPEDADGFRRFLRHNRSKLEKFTPFLESPFESWRDLAKLRMLKLLPLLRPWRSLDGDLRTYFRDERIRLGFSFQSKYLGMSPFTCPSLFSILSFLEYEHGVFHPVGGCGAVTKAMARIAEQLGARVLLNEPVEDMIFEGRKCTAVRTARRTLTADAVIVNADFAQAMRRMVPNNLRRRWTDQQIEKKSFSCSTFMMYLGIEGRYEDVSHHTIYLAKDYRQNLQDIEQLHQLSADPSFYVQNACVTDPSLAPKNMSTLYVLLPVTHEHGNVDWAAEKDRFRQLALQQLQKIGIDDVESRIRFEKILTPADWRTEYALHKGATFSMTHNLGQMLHLRPHNRFEDLDRVYLVGGGTHPGSGLPVIFESARITSRLLLEDLGMEPQWDTAPVLADAAVLEAAS
jgi:phytoene desaturase